MYNYYTVFNDERIDSYIEGHLRYIVKNILEVAPNPDAIVLTGGFGRGEGSVLREGAVVKPLNDYDFVIFAPTRFDIPEVLSRLTSQLAREIGIDFVDIGFMSTHQLDSLPPTIFNYDLKYGSNVIYGNKDILNTIPAYSPKDIPLWEGQRLLFNRMAGILGGFSVDRFHRELTGTETQYMNNQVLKALLACGDALILLQGEYNHLYQVRQETFNCIFKKGIYPFLTEEDFRLINSAYANKLTPTVSKKNVKVYFLEALPIFKKVFIEFSSKYLNCGGLDIYRFVNAYASFRSDRNLSLSEKGFKFLSALKMNDILIYRQIWQTVVLSLMDQIYVFLPLILFSMPSYDRAERLLAMGEGIASFISMEEFQKFRNKKYDERWELLRKHGFSMWEKYCH